MYNSITNRCEGASACTSPATWNSATGKCVTTYAATAGTVGGLTYDNCEGGDLGWNDAYNYCASKGMRLPTAGETVAGGGCVPSCSSNFWTWTSTPVDDGYGGYNILIWSDGYLYDHPDYDSEVRCVK
jgi:hypothetical protein